MMYLHSMTIAPATTLHTIKTENISQRTFSTQPLVNHYQQLNTISPNTAAVEEGKNMFTMESYRTNKQMPL